VKYEIKVQREYPCIMAWRNEVYQIGNNLSLTKGKLGYRGRSSGFRANYPERLKDDVKGAINASERVFYYVGLLNSVRDFLFYDQIKPEKLGISKIYDYYMANH
jgi:hypothetical protein